MLLHIFQREIISKEKTLLSEAGLPTSAAGLSIDCNHGKKYISYEVYFKAMGGFRIFKGGVPASISLNSLPKLNHILLYTDLVKNFYKSLIFTGKGTLPLNRVSRTFGLMCKKSTVRLNWHSS